MDANVFFVPPMFFVIAFVFSMLGMGGSQLYIPILFWSGLDFKTQAIPLGMLLNLVNTVSASVTYGRRHMIDWAVALPLGLVMAAVAPLGVWLNISLPTAPVIVAFAAFTAGAAVLMLFGSQPRTKLQSRSSRLLLGLGCGSGLGFMTGLIGRGGGSFVVPILYMVGLEARVAAASSAAAVSFSGLSSFIGHVTTAARPNWLLWLLCAAAVLAGSQLGSRVMAARLRGRALRGVFAIVLLAVAALLVVKDVLLK